MWSPEPLYCPVSRLFTRRYWPVSKSPTRNFLGVWPLDHLLLLLLERKTWNWLRSRSGSGASRICSCWDPYPVSKFRSSQWSRAFEFFSSHCWGGLYILTERSARKSRGFIVALDRGGNHVSRLLSLVFSLTLQRSRFLGGDKNFGRGRNFGKIPGKGNILGEGKICGKKPGRGRFLSSASQ